MPDLNKTLNNIQQITSKIDIDVQGLLDQYNDLYRESTRLFNEERIASEGKMDGLEDFYRLTQIIRRNRDVIGSINRGMKNIRAMDQFKIIEEDIKPVKPKMKKAKKIAEPVINEQNIQDLQIPEDAIKEVPKEAVTEVTDA